MDETLFLFIQSDDHLLDIRRLLDWGVNPNYQIYGGVTPLHAASMCSRNNIEIVRELIKRGADVSLKDHLGNTVLHYAEKCHKKSIVKELFKSRDLVDSKTTAGSKPLVVPVTISTREGSTTLASDPWIRSYISKRGDTGYDTIDVLGHSPPVVAIEEKRQGPANFLLNERADPNVLGDLDAPLHVAFSEQFYRAAIELLTNGARIRFANREGKTPLDILFEHIVFDKLSRKLAPLFMKYAAFRYDVTDHLDRELERFPELLQSSKRLGEEIDCVKNANVTEKVFHVIVVNCFRVIGKLQHFESHIIRRYELVTERIMIDLYPDYFLEVFGWISVSSLLAMLEITVERRKKSKWRNNARLFSNTDVVCYLSSYLPRFDTFCLLASISNVRAPDVMQDIHLRFSETTQD